MSNDVVIRVEEVSKLYRLGTIGASTLRGDFERWWARLRGRPDPLAPVDPAESRIPLPHSALRIPHSNHSAFRNGIIWALRDVSFEVKQGEVLGIIGRNGAGKSTLLKLLAQVTAPTSGQIKMRGRLASLLEVGTGFHPELTGRENIYLNGAILGMRKAEIDKKFDEIVDFSGVEQFIDTPVKRYSSGMYVRLAFAVAAHLDPEILLVDEVLAVGDAAFQRKCVGKMGGVAREGRTVLFVSHNMLAIRSLCSRCAYIDEGKLATVGSVETCIDGYLLAHAAVGTAELETDRLQRPESRDNLGDDLKITGVRLHTNSGQAVLNAEEPVKVTLRFRVSSTVREATWGFAIETPDSVRVLEFSSVVAFGGVDLVPGLYESTGLLERCPLRPGLYKLVVGARAPHKGLDWLPEAMFFHVEDDSNHESLWMEYNSGLVRLPCTWTAPTSVEAH
jgi:lipopolysaccharide transport system ATP-binding protein